MLDCGRAHSTVPTLALAVRLRELHDFLIEINFWIDLGQE